MSEEQSEASRRLGWIGRAPELFPAVAAVAVFVFWVSSQGGLEATDSHPGALILLGLLAATAYAYRGRILRLPRLVRIALALLGLFVVWNFLSIMWADDQGAAWDGANLCLLYLIVFTLFVVPSWRPGAAALLLGAFALAITVVGLVVFFKAASSADPLDYFIIGRFSEPLGYHNANAAIFTMSMFPAVFLAARRETPWPARGLMLACAGVLFQLALMPQSRGWLIAAPLAAVAYLLIVPGLVRSLTVLIPLGGVMALTASPILHVFNISNDQSKFGPALDDARSAIIIAALVLFAVGAAIGFADSRWQPSERTARVGSRAVLGATGVAALAGVVAAIAVIGSPVGWTSDRWHDFKAGKFDYQVGGGSRLGEGLGSNRYDFWRVAADDFKTEPLIGVGSDNFAEDYIRDRRSGEQPTYPHNVPLQILAGTGVIGGLLFGSFLVVTLVGVGRVRLGAQEPLARGIGGLAVVVFLYWLFHSIGEWFWAFPALCAPVFAWLGMGMSLDPERTTSARPSWGRWALPGTIIGAVLGLVAAVSLFLPWAAAIDVKRATDSWPADPKAAFDRLDQARDLNFLSATPDLVAGAIASQLGDQARMRTSFDRALARDPRNWYATLELAVLDGVQGDSKSAIRRLDRVSELNPRESLTAKVREGVLSGHPISPRKVDSIFLVRYCEIIGRPVSKNGGCS
ncbi:MAG: O-antigen ligase family protein [Solirubrobacterales bacterium]